MDMHAAHLIAQPQSPAFLPVGRGAEGSHYYPVSCGQPIIQNKIYEWRVMQYLQAITRTLSRSTAGCAVQHHSGQRRCPAPPSLSSQYSFLLHTTDCALAA